MTVPEHKVRAELAAAGVELRGPLPGVGGTVRAPGIGKGPANDACAVTVLPDRVLYLDHSSGASGVIWSDGPGASRRTPTREEIEEAERVSKLAAEQRAERHRAGTADAVRAWSAARPASTHPYLVAKAVRVDGLRVDPAGELLVPRHGIDGALVGLQRIGSRPGPDGRFPRRYAAGAPTRGTFFLLGNVDPDGTLCVAEGLATAATVHAEAGHPTVVAFDAGNLEAVALAWRERCPRADLIVCADDDWTTVGNPGRTKAIGAARAVGGRVALPTFCAGCAGCSDFNDLHLCARRRSGS